jgi:hypothetical protein
MKRSLAAFFHRDAGRLYALTKWTAAALTFVIASKLTDPVRDLMLPHGEPKRQRHIGADLMKRPAKTQAGKIRAAAVG